MKISISKSKNSASSYVHKTIRKPNGCVITVTVEKLGNLTEVTAKAGGKGPYVWSQEYVNYLNRKEYDENKEVIVSCSPSKLLRKGAQKLFNCGYLFLQDVYYRLGLDKICRDISSRHSFEYMQTEDHIRAHFITYFMALVVYRILEKKLHEAAVFRTDY